MLAVEGCAAVDREEAVTLIATAISPHGIVQASSTSLTARAGVKASGARALRLRLANAALSVTGDYTVDHRPFDEWLRSSVDEYVEAAKQPTLAGLAEHLRTKLTPQPAPKHRRMIHLAGYAEGEGGAHPELYFIRNFSGMAVDGGYDKPCHDFYVSEEFWSRDYKDPSISDTIASGGAHFYFNGSARDRVAYMVLNQRIHGFYRDLWSSSRRFRRPDSLEDVARLLDLNLRFTGVFLGSDEAGRSMPHGVEMVTIPAPSNAVKL